MGERVYLRDSCKNLSCKLRGFSPLNTNKKRKKKINVRLFEMLLKVNQLIGPIDLYISKEILQ